MFKKRKRMNIIEPICQPMPTIRRGEKIHNYLTLYGMRWKKGKTNSLEELVTLISLDG